MPLTRDSRRMDTSVLYYCYDTCHGKNKLLPYYSVTNNIAFESLGTKLTLSHQDSKQDMRSVMSCNKITSTPVVVY